MFLPQVKYYIEKGKRKKEYIYMQNSTQEQ